MGGTLPSLQKAHVRDALITWNSCHNNPVPHFTTRKKSCCVWSKFYVSITNTNELKFVELYPCFRFLWRLLGWYKETIIEASNLGKS